jgi:hypothetical protein
VRFHHALNKMPATGVLLNMYRIITVALVAVGLHFKVSISYFEEY